MAKRYILAHYPGESYMEELKETETPFRGVPIYVRIEDCDELLAGLRAAEKALREEGCEDDADSARSILAKHGGAQ